MTSVDGRMHIAFDASSLQAKDSQEVDLRYSYQTKLKIRPSMYLFMKLGVPTRDVRFSLTYAGVDVHGMSTLDMFVAKAKARTTYRPSETRADSVEVSCSRWVLPKSGVVFSWSSQEGGAT